MNRIQNPTKSPDKAPTPSKFQVESGLFVTQPAHDCSHSLFGPKHYESGYAYPLIVWLHAPASDERQLVRIMPSISLRNYVAVAPRGFALDEKTRSRRQYGWPQTPQEIQEAEARVHHSIEIARQKFHVAENRIFLAGFGAGGTMAFRVAMNDPGRFAGVLSICGAFPSGHTPFGRLTLARQLPVYLAVGRDSTDYAPAEACENLRLFHAAGLSIVLRQYPCGQELTEQMLRDVDRWIMEQITAGADRVG
jgi:phospholipase/carboxylesterase